MENINGHISLSLLKEALPYKSFKGLSDNFSAATGEVLVDSPSFQIETPTVERFLWAISRPQKGRSANIAAAANALLRHIIKCKVEQEEATFSAFPDGEVTFQPTFEVLEKVGKVGKEGGANFSEPEKVESPAIEVLGKVEAKKRIGFSALDLVFYFNMAVVNYGLWYFLREYGAALGGIYALLSIHAMQMAKNPASVKTAERGVVAIWVLEIAGFWIHLSMVNLKIWQAMLYRHSLPFNYWDNPGTMAYPFYIAACIAAMLSGAAIYSVTTTLALNKEMNNQK